MLKALFAVCFLASLLSLSKAFSFHEKNFHNPKFSTALSDAQLGRLADQAKSEQASLDIRKGDLLSPLLVPRQIGTPGYYRAQDHIVTELKKHGYTIGWDNFTFSTPGGNLPFSNIVATKNPLATNRLVLAAHYESKIVEGGDFVGAIDSAVPVALMLDAARGLSDILNKSSNDDISLQLVFFDGEEAFHEWTRNDSLYGSRHLAQMWEDNVTPRKVSSGSSETTDNSIPELDRIDVLVVLDLIGAPGLTFHDTQPKTSVLFKEFAKLEERLRTSKHIESSFFVSNEMRIYGHIDDDQRPFVERGVPALHLIATPFPKVWHELSDNADALDSTVINDFSLLLRSFVASYLQLWV
ncbi:hypothetical protein H4219_000153 [Mycoemilia scoparia]|uniref:Peptide hydrolase n=1 Tax=Mycoemilia scoparia TaxID=417184 RepID=A0A9W8A6U8_9FUNG|nr:hypothetical protein H4219_000153 [Mycoemilia scoparia]